MFSLFKRPFLKRGLVLLTLALAFMALLNPTPTRASVTFPSSNAIYLQTTGERAGVGIGDYISNIAGDNLHHLVAIGIPCISNATFRVELFDPEMFESVGELVNDEIRAPVDQTNFILRRPDNSAFAPVTVYTSLIATHDVWNAYQTITLPAAPVNGFDCGMFTLETWTGNELAITGQNNDDNAWRYRVLGGPGAVGTETFDAALGPDGRAATGDEVWLGVQRLSYQNNTSVTNTFYWYVDDDGTPTFNAHNFDMDPTTLPCIGVCQVEYFPPTLPSSFGTLGAADGQWNPGQAGRVGDAFDTPGVNTEPGLWSAEVTVNLNNQYIFEVDNANKPLFLDPPLLPQMQVAKDDGVTLVTSPGTTTYTITITNSGPGALLPIGGFEVVDTLPAGMTFTGCTLNPPLEGTCSGGGQTANFNLVGQSAPLESGGAPFGQPILAFLPGTGSGLRNFGTLTVTAAIAPGLAGGTLLTNTVELDGTDVFANNLVTVTAQDTDTVLATSADVVITKTDAVDPVNAGTNVTYNLVVRNNGPDTAANVSVTDTLPGGLTFVSATPPCTEAGGLVTCNLGDMTNGQVINLAVVVTTPAGVATTYTNTAQVTSSTPDSDPSNNDDPEDTTTIIPSTSADVSLIKSDAVDPVLVGTNITYNLVVTNNGPDTATAVTVTDTLPGGVTFVSATPPCTEAGGLVTCNLGDMTNGQVVNLSIVVTAPAAPTTLSNTAQATSSTPDPDPANNDDPEDTTVVPLGGPEADLSILKTDVVDPVQAGADVTYTLTVTNNGPDTATSVQVTDNLPAGVTFISATPPCTEAGGVVSCALGDMVNGATMNLSIVVRTTAGVATTLSNTASTSSTTFDPDPSDNGDPETTTIQTGGGNPNNNTVMRFDPALSKLGTLAPGQIGLPGEQITWTLTVVNNGALPGFDIIITDILVPELRIDNATTAGGTVSISGQTVTFTIPVLNPGQAVEMQIFTTVLRNPASGVISNIATLSGFNGSSGGGIINTSGAFSVPVITGLPATGYPPQK